MVERDGDGFIERWSRRKRGEEPPDGPDSEIETETAAAEPKSPDSGEDPDAGDPEVIAKLPDLETLDDDSDFTGFLQDGVPEALRRQALRRLWRVNPILANLDGLNDYDENYSLLGMVTEQIQSLYRVGKGYLDEDEPDGPDGEETETEGGGEIAEGAAEGHEESATPDPEETAESTPDPEPDDSSDPVEPVQAAQVAPESDPGPGTGGNHEPEPARPAPGSALARRWGGSPDKG
jgi:hypothetical protein